MKSAPKAIQSVLYGKLKYISRFSMVGFINTIVDFLVFTLCHDFISFTYTNSQIIGYSFGILNSFILNKKWTFEDLNSNKKMFHEFTQFMIVNFFSLTLTVVAMNYLIKNLLLNVYVSKVIVTALAQFSNFIGYKLWVFNRRK